MNRLAPGLFYGQEALGKQMGGLTLSERVYGPNQNLSRHVHERAYLSFLLQGAYTEICGKRAFDCAPSFLILHPRGEAHANRFLASGGHIFNIELTPEWMERIEALPPVVRRRIEAQGAKYIRLMQRIYREFRHTDAVSSLAVEGLTLELLAALAREPSPTTESRPPRWLAQVRDLLYANYRDDWTLTALAAEAKVHPTHLARAFRQHYRCAIGEYVRQCRVAFACARLTDTDLALSEIAREAGFADQSHFSRIFKRHYDVSPAVYREASRRR